MIRTIAISTFILFVIIQLTNIIGSFLPVGVGTVGEISMETHQIDDLNYNESTMKLMLTNDRMNFISSRPKSYYSLNKFYGRNAMLAGLSAFLLSIVLFLIKELPSKRRLLICAIFGLLIVTSVHLSYWNWWGFSNRYSIGVSLSSFVSIVLCTSVANQFVFTKKNQSKTI